MTTIQSNELRWLNDVSVEEAMEEQGREIASRQKAKQATVKLYVSSASDVPAEKFARSDEKGLYFKAQAYEVASAAYPETIVDDYEYEMPDGEMTSDDSVVDEEYEDQQQELLDEMEEVYGDT